MHAFLLCFVLGTLVHGNVYLGDAELAELISAPIRYKEIVLILSDQNGVAVVLFTTSIEKGHKYKFRYYDKRLEKETEGEGVVFEKYLKKATSDPKKFDVTDIGSQLKIKAGKIELNWSLETDDRGWVYYHPEFLTVQIAKMAYFKEIDMRRYLRP